MNEIEKLEKFLPVTKIKLPRSNKINRAIYTDGTRYFIDCGMSYKTYTYNGKEYTEVVKSIISEEEHWHTK